MKPSRDITTLALDLEGTLISNAVSQFPRPGLFAFLEFCRDRVPHLVIYTAVSETRFRDVSRRLVDEGSAPEWFAKLPHLQCTGQYKDLRLIEGAEISTTLLLDDLESYVHPEQREQWIRIAPFEAPYTDEDRELVRVMGLLRGHSA